MLITGKPEVEAVFVVTKPLQLIVAEIIKQQLGYKKCSLLIINQFADAQNVCNRVRDHEDWEEVVFFTNRWSAVKFLIGGVSFSSLYVHEDAGLKHHIRMKVVKFFKKSIQINVYEEGIGSYRVDVLKPSLKKKLYNMLGIGVVFGGSKYTNLFYLFEPNRISIAQQTVREKVRRIETSLVAHLESQLKRYQYYFDTEECFKDLQGLVCILYLSSWQVDESFINKLPHLTDERATLVFKPHPNIKNYLNYNLFDFVVPNRVPAELLLIHLANSFESVKVFHHNSSAAQYVSSSGIEYQNIS